MDLNDIEKDVAINNVRRLEEKVETVLERFETSPNFHIVSYENEWINHPDEYFVKSDVFRNLFKNFFDNINLQNFLTHDHIFDVDENINKLNDFHNSCDMLYSNLSYDEVECASNQLAKLHARLLNL